MMRRRQFFHKTQILGNRHGFITGLGIFCLTFLTAWAVAEFFLLPYVLEAPSRRAFLMGFCARPGAMIDGVPINSMGFTGRPITRKKPPGSVRILTLGGSAFFNRNITLCLEKSLQRLTSSPVEVLGGALRVHNSMSSVHKFRSLADFNFDYVFIYHGVNDLDANHTAPDDFSADYSHLNPFYKRNFFLDHSLAARVIYNRFLYKRPGSVLMGSGFASEKVFEKNLEILVDEIRDSGARPVLMTFAWSLPENYSPAAFRAQTLGYNNPERYDVCPAGMWGGPSYLRQGLARHNAVIRKTTASKGVLLIDQEKLVGGDPFWFGDPVHFSEPGVSRFVQNISDFFMSEKLL